MHVEGFALRRSVASIGAVACGGPATPTGTRLRVLRVQAAHVGGDEGGAQDEDDLAMTEVGRFNKCTFIY
ncbi:hypothetical protein [Actinomadura sp. 3N407]|uniref:hypothetical protein n=1 Tax=Actinomadura sp. 3N407 TaxID=3457423 RepID=UPI003FCDDF92